MHPPMTTIAARLPSSGKLILAPYDIARYHTNKVRITAMIALPISLSPSSNQITTYHKSKGLIFSIFYIAFILITFL